MNHVSCEIYAAGHNLRGDPFTRDNYIVTVLLTLQVDDASDITPSLGVINPLTGTDLITTTLAADLGGARHRTFTANYTLDAPVLMASKAFQADAKDSTCRPPATKQFYRLDGNLGLEEIINDGLATTSGESNVALHRPKDTADKTAPTFGSNVQFIVTRSITGLGPVWTIKRFKGPGGTNGLFNAKRIDTDSVLLTFAAANFVMGETAAQKGAGRKAATAKAAVESATTDLAARERDAGAAKALAESAHYRVESEVRLRRGALGLRAVVPGNLVRDAVRLDESSLAAQRNVSMARAYLNEKRAAFTAAEVEKNDADQDAREQSDSEAKATALGAAQSLQTTMILQNLVGVLPPR